jgi:diguanylate cyclase (GGDEF)-like protein
MTRAHDDGLRRDSDADADLLDALAGLVGDNPRDGSRLDAELRELAKSYEGRVYQELIQQLTSLELNNEDGAGYWRAVVGHQEFMEERLGKPVDVRVAMLDWLLEARALEEPRIVELAKFERLQSSVHKDGLTGLYNFRFFDEHLRREIAKNGRKLSPLSVAMIDIDHFKLYNDTHGHEAGNEALIAVGRVLTDSLRQHDICARYGGEEFVLVLSDTPKSDAREVADRARRSIEDRIEEIADVTLAGPLTISIGLATYPADAVEAGALIREADQALYTAKANGRNQVQMAGDLPRSFRRTDMRLTGRFRTLTEGYEAFDTYSVGEGGFAMRVERELTPGSLVEVAIEAPDGGRDLVVTGRVVYTRLTGDTDFETGVNITEIDDEGQALLGRVMGDAE